MQSNIVCLFDCASDMYRTRRLWIVVWGHCRPTRVDPIGTTTESGTAGFCLPCGATPRQARDCACFTGVSFAFCVFDGREGYAVGCVVLEIRLASFQPQHCTAVSTPGTQLTHGAYSNIWKYPQAASGIGTLTLRKNRWFSFNTVGDAPATLATTAIAVPPLTTATSEHITAVVYDRVSSSPARDTIDAASADTLARSKPTLTTPSVSARSLVVRLNVLSSVRGWVRCELRDAASGIPIPGYDLNSSVVIVAQNALSAPLRWQSDQGRGPLSPVQLVTVHFQATFSKLFSFELVWE